MFALLFNLPALFAALKEKPGRQWWFPLIITTVLGAAGIFLALQRTDLESAIGESIMESGQKMSADQAAQGAEIGAKFARISMTVAAVCAPLVVFVAAAAWFWMAANLSKTPTTFMAMLGLYSWTNMINVPRSLLGLVGLVRAGEIGSFKVLSAIDPLTPLTFVGDPSELSLHAIGLLSKFNLFTLAHLALMALGVSAMTGMSRTRAFIFAYLPWCISLAWAALQYFMHRGS